jgi:dihydrofolate reductase
MSWAHHRDADAEWRAFTAENASGESQLLFGRKTYELMVKYWPTPEAKEKDPKVAGGMNTLPKLVFSRTLTSVSWANTEVVKGDPAAEVRKLKSEPGPVLVIMGSGTIVASLAAAGLIDEYQLVVTPVALGRDGRCSRAPEDHAPVADALARLQEREGPAPLRAGVTEDAGDAPARRAAEAVARRSYGRLVAFLAARTRDVAAAEDALSEAFAAALADWPRSGCPANPEGWLMTVARRKLIDAARRRGSAEAAAAQVRLLAEGLAAVEEAGIPDRRPR